MGAVLPCQQPVTNHQQLHSMAFLRDWLRRFRQRRHVRPWAFSAVVLLISLPLLRPFRHPGTGDLRRDGALATTAAAGRAEDLGDPGHLLRRDRQGLPGRAALQRPAADDGPAAGGAVLGAAPVGPRSRPTRTSSRTSSRSSGRPSRSRSRRDSSTAWAGCSSSGAGAPGWRSGGAGQWADQLRHRAEFTPPAAAWSWRRRRASFT